MKNLISVFKFLQSTVCLAGLVLVFAGCTVSRKNWKNHEDSCISISENPPLKRIINYTDHELCKRKLSPRKAPNPQTRANNEKD